jgi:hypothetical protein
MADRSASSNIYTVLALVAFLALACAIGYVWYRSNQLFGPDSNPFRVQRTSQVTVTLDVA